MSEYKDLLEAYFASKGSDDPEDIQKAQNAVEAILQELVKVRQSGEGNDINNLYQNLDDFINKNNTEENKEKVIDLFNDVEVQLRNKGYKGNFDDINFNEFLYAYAKKHFVDFDPYLEKLSENNVVRFICDPDLSSTEYKIKSLERVKLSQEKWDEIYKHHAESDEVLFMSAGEKKELMSYLIKKASLNLVAESLAEKEIEENTWTEEKFNEYIQFGADPKRLCLMAAMSGQIKAFSFLATKISDEERALVIENAISGYKANGSLDPEYKFLDYLIDNDYPMGQPFSEQNAFLTARGKTPLMWALQRFGPMSSPFYHVLVERDVDLNVNYVDSTNQSALSLALASFEEKSEKIEFLIKKGANVTENLLPDFVKWTFAYVKFDILRDLIKTNKIACADVFKLIYDKNLEKYRLPILSFIRTNFPDFTLTDKEADEALDFFVKNKDLVAVETILKMGAKPEKLSKDDLVEFITLVYLFRPGSDLDLWNTKKNMLQKIEELVKNGHISGDVFFDSFFKCLKQDMENKSYDTLMHKANILKKYEEKLQLSDDNVSRYLNSLTSFLKENGENDDLPLSFVSKIAPFLLKRRPKESQLTKDQVQLLTSFSIRKVDEKLILSLIENGDLTLDELFSYLLSDKLEEEHHKNFILVIIQKNNPNFQPAPEVARQAFLHCVNMGAVESTRYLTYMGFDISEYRSEAIKIAATSDNVNLDMLYVLIKNEQNAREALDLMAEKSLPNGTISRIASDFKVDITKLQPQSLEALIREVFVPVDEKGKGELNKLSESNDDFGGYRGLSPLRRSDRGESSNDGNSQELREEVKNNLLALKNNAQIKESVFVSALLKDVSRQSANQTMEMLKRLNLRDAVGALDQILKKEVSILIIPEFVKLVLDFIKEYKVDITKLQQESLERLIGAAFVSLSNAGGRLLLENGEYLWDPGAPDLDSTQRLKGRLLALKDSSKISDAVFVSAALGEISKGNFKTGASILIRLQDKDLDLTEEQRKAFLEKLPKYCEKLLTHSENSGGDAIDDTFDLIEKLVKGDASFIPSDPEAVKVISKLALMTEKTGLIDLMRERELITYNDILNLVNEPSDPFVFYSAIKYFRKNKINFKPSLESGQRALRYCVNEDDRKGVEFLIASGVNPAAYDSESLKVAVSSQNVSSNRSFSMIDVLLDSGANPKARAFEFILLAIELADKHHWPDLDPNNIDNNLAKRDFYLNVTARLLIKSFPDLKDAIEDLFSKENPDDDRPNVNVESVLELIESILDPIQKEAFELVKLRRKLQKEAAEYAGDDSLCRKANEHFDKVVEPHLRKAFEAVPGRTNIMKVEFLEKKIKELILDRIVFVNQDEKDPQAQALVKFIQENKAALIHGRNESINDRMRELAISKSDNAQFAWRAYDPKAPHDPEFENLLTPQTSKRSIHTTRAATGSDEAMTPIKASEICRLRVAYYFLALENKEIDIDNFFQQLADIRHAHPDPDNPNGVDSPSCFPGTIGRIGKMGAGNEKLQLPPDRQEIIKEAVNTMVMSLYGSKISGLDRDKALKLYNSLVNMSMKNAVEIVDGTEVDFLRYKPKMLALRRQFLDELGSESHKLAQIDAKLVENKEPKIFYKDYGFISRQFLDIGAGRANELYDKIPPEKVEPIVEVLESAQPEVKAAEVTNPFSISIRQVSMMKSLIMQNAYVDKQLRAFIEFELLSNAISAHVNVSKDLLEAFTKKLVEEIANPDSEELDECLNKAFDNALGAHQSDFNAEELSSLINHREAILAQSLFKGLNEDRVEEINAILKSKMKASNDNTFNDLIDRRFQQLQNKLPVYPSKKGKEPESSDHKGKKRM